mgnify:CR=1 FL=1
MMLFLVPVLALLSACNEQKNDAGEKAYIDQLFKESQNVPRLRVDTTTHIDTAVTSLEACERVYSSFKQAGHLVIELYGDTLIGKVPAPW